MSRASIHADVAAALERLTDDEIAARLDDAREHGRSIGGATCRLDVEGVPVFAKRVPLTATERAAPGSTANLFDLPMFYQYGVGSAGFGAWRELAAHTMTTGWVLDGSCGSFPLTYHRRVLEGFPAQPGDIDETVAYWEGSPGVRRRLTEIAEAPASLVLFLEFVPSTVNAWLIERLADGSVDDALAAVDRWLRDDVAFLRSRGFVHFDAHFNNILTDGTRLYFADFGLANSLDFTHSAAERAFVERHLDYDRAETEMMVGWWIANRMNGGADPGDFVRAVVAGRDPAGLPPVARALMRRHAPVTALMGEAFERWMKESKLAPWPAEELARVWAAE